MVEIVTIKLICDIVTRLEAFFGHIFPVVLLLLLLFLHLDTHPEFNRSAQQLFAFGHHIESPLPESTDHLHNSDIIPGR